MFQDIQHILDWIGNFNKSIIEQFPYYSVAPISIWNEEVPAIQPVVPIEGIITHCVNTIIESHKRGLENCYGMTDCRRGFPSISAYMEEYKSIKLGDNIYIKIEEEENNSIVREYILMQLLRLLLPHVANDKELKNYNIDFQCFNDLIFIIESYEYKVVKSYDEFKIWSDYIPHTSDENFQVGKLEEFEAKIKYTGPIDELSKFPDEITYHGVYDKDDYFYGENNFYNFKVIINSDYDIIIKLK